MNVNLTASKIVNSRPHCFENCLRLVQGLPCMAFNEYVNEWIRVTKVWIESHHRFHASIISTRVNVVNTQSIAIINTTKKKIWKEGKSIHLLTCVFSGCVSIRITYFCWLKITHETDWWVVVRSNDGSVMIRRSFNKLKSIKKSDVTHHHRSTHNPIKKSVE